MVIAILMTFFFNPDHLSDLCVFTVYCFYTLAFFGLFVLRCRRTEPRPFSVPLYPLVPLVALGGGLFILGSEVVNDPWGVVLFIGVVVLGLPILWLIKTLDRKRQF